MQESNCLVRRLWHGSICILELANRWVNLRHNLGKAQRILQPQSNEVQAHFNLLTSFRQVNCSVDEWYNAVQPWVNLAKYPQKLPRSSTETFSGLCCEMKSLYQETSVMGVWIWTCFLQARCTACKKNGEF